MTNSITDDDLQAYLRRIVEAGIFEQGSLRYRLLEHLIQTELDGHGDTLKAYTIGLDVFEKPDTFDPSTDSSVRVGIGRLRTALAMFESSGKADIDLIVDVPVGTYRPTLTRRKTASKASAVAPKAQSKPRRQRRILKGKLIWGGIGFVFGMALLAGAYLWRDTTQDDTIIALEIENFSGSQSLAMQTSSTLRRVLSRSAAITVISDNNVDLVQDNTDLILHGHVNRTLDGTANVSIELTSADSNSVIWAKSTTFVDDALLQSRIEQALGHEVRLRVLETTRETLAARNPRTLPPEQLFIMAMWPMNPTANAVDWDLERIGLMELALEKDPEFGAAHAFLAQKMAYLANIHAPVNTETYRNQALEHVQRARDLSPLDPNVLFRIGQALWHSGQIGASLTAMERVAELNSNHTSARFLKTVIPYTCSPAPDSVLQWAKSFDADLSRDSPTRWLVLTWIALLHTNRSEYTDALQAERRAALISSTPYSFMRHALLLHKTGQTEDAATVIRAQKSQWPEFDPTYFADVTNPRLCSESDESSNLIENYQELAVAMAGKI